ncbi:MAG: phosphoribosyltransferase family protein [Cyclobacteriaceae bacterium]
MVDQIITKPSWPNVNDACKQLVGEINQQGHNIQYIVGITRGGLIPSVIISHLMGIPTVTVSYSSQSGAGDNKFYNNELPDIQSTMHRDKVIPGFPEILVVDDICDSGETMADVCSIYKDKGHKVRSIALYHKEGSVFTPEFHWQQIPKDSGWITFPWEV